MAKGGKLMRLKSVLKKLNSFNNNNNNNKQSRPSKIGSSISVTNDDISSSYSSGDLHPVYVGKSRRRYLISSDIIDHPLFRELAERSSTEESPDTINVACEVVLFEHLLWMLENADPQPESLDELVEFYAC
ncbi:auxin-responsive protein SAUR76 [Populus nigra]|uniref:auxin-responsive protein SAUR76 n=1 Tax=Populus nigra TaxID=3691 RepID=UPI002B27353E|nr:auxin-responsive protein SAUR76 [Populus nigra]